MKTWFLIAGMLGVGIIALVGGSEWSSTKAPPESNEFLEEEASPLAGLEDITPPEAPTPKPSSPKLELRMPLDEPFPLLKTVEQVLVQKTEDGERVSHSSLELAVTMRLKQKRRDGSRLLSVVYNRVRYRQDVAGRAFVFDSTLPEKKLPVEALPYKGLAGNGFSFWIGKDHMIQKPVDFADFLNRCVREVPPARRERVLAAFSNAADEGLANFVDDSIGFLPPDPQVNEGDTWTRDRRLSQPIPLLLQSRCTLDRLTNRFAEIAIDGTIATTKNTGSPSDDLQVIVRGGRSTGRCQIDRETGLPFHSEIKRIVDMEVKLANGPSFDQQKITTTTIRLFPQQSPQNESPVIQASGESPARN